MRTTVLLDPFTLRMDPCPVNPRKATGDDYRLEGIALSKRGVPFHLRADLKRAALKARGIEEETGDVAEVTAFTGWLMDVTDETLGEMLGQIEEGW